MSKSDSSSTSSGFGSLIQSLLPIVVVVALFFFLQPLLALLKGISDILNFTFSIIQGVIEAVTAGFSKLWSGVTWVWNGITNVWDGVTGAFKSAWDGITDTADWVGDRTEDFFGCVTSPIDCARRNF